MKRCPECRRDYYDDTLLYCLDDGNALLEGPASVDEPATAILNDTAGLNESATRAQVFTTDQTAVLPNLHPHTASKKNSLIAGIVGIVVVTALGLGSYWMYGRQDSNQISSIAVMPFENRNSDADTDYLSDGLAESVIFRLTQIPDLRVSPTSSVMRYKGASTDVAKIASELGVDAVMTGRLTKRGDNLNITVELVDARTNKSLWGEQYERKLSELLTTQREIVTEIVGKLQLKLSGESEQKLAKKYTANPKAYELYLKGRFYWNTRKVEDMRRALDHFTRAAEADPNFALAYTGIADANSLMVSYQVLTSHDGMPKAREAALKALQLDDTLAEAHTALAGVLADYDYDSPAAERSYKRAIELNPNYATARQWYAEFLTRQGRAEESLRESAMAIQIDPQSQTFNRIHALGLLFARRYSEAEAQAKKTLELDRSLPFPHIDLFDIYLMQGKYAEAVESYATWAEMRGEKATANEVRSSFAKAGWSAALRSILTTPNIRNYTEACINALLGNKDEAFAALDRTLEERTFEIQQIKVDPLLDSLRDDPRYKDLLKRMGLPE